MQNNNLKNKKMVWGWLQKAGDDLSFARDAFKETTYYDHVCFLSQQAVEKYIKALVIIANGCLTKEDKTHNLIYLMRVCRKILDLKQFEGALRQLSNAYIPARYPSNGYVKFNRQEAKACLEKAEEVIDFIQSKVDFGPYYK